MSTPHRFDGQAKLHAQIISYIRNSHQEIARAFERNRKLGLFQLMLIIQASHFGLSSGGGQSWEDAIEDVATAFGSLLNWGRQPSCSVKAFHDARRKVDDEALEALEQAVYGAIEYGPRYRQMSSLHGYRFLLGDGTQIRTARGPELIKEVGLQTNGKSSSSHYPSLLLVTLIEAGTNRVIANQLARCKAKAQSENQNRDQKRDDMLPMDERAAFECMRPHLQEKDCVLLDSGFASYESLWKMCTEHQPFMMAIPKSWALTKRFRNRKQSDAVISFEIPNSNRSKACRGRKLRLRVFRITGSENEPKYIATNLIEEFTLSECRKVYKLRWGVEIFFRNAKKHLSLRRLRSRTLIGVKLEIYAIMLYMQWLATVQTLVAQAANAPQCALEILVDGYEKIKISSAFKLARDCLGASLAKGPTHWRRQGADRLRIALATLGRIVSGRSFPRISHDPIGVFMPKRPDRAHR